MPGQTVTDYVEENNRRLLNRPVGKDCVLDLRFLDGAGTTVTDLSGRENHASVTLGSKAEADFWTTGAFGPAASLENVDDTYITVPHDATLNLGQSFTVELLVEGVYSDTPYLYDKSGDYHLYTDGGLVNASGIGGTQAFMGDQSLTHIVATAEGGDSAVWVNGVRGETGSGTDLTSASGDLYIGTRQSNTAAYNFDGLVHAFRVYSRGFGREEIRQTISHQVQQGVLQYKTAWFDGSWTEQMAMDPANNQLDMSSDGAHLYVNGSGEIIAVDEAGNESTLT